MTVSEGFELHGATLDPAHADSLREQGLGYIDRESGDTIIINLQDVTQPNSVLVAVLLAWYRRCYQLEKNLHLAHPSPGLQAIISFSGLDELFSQ